MILTRDLFEGGLDVHPGTPINADANSDITGDRISLSKYGRAYYLLAKPAGTAGDDLSFHVKQHTAASAGQSKALKVRRLWHKVGNPASVGQWTKVELAVPTDDFDLDAVNGVDLAADEAAAVILVEVITDDLDGTNGFTFVSVDHAGADVGNALIVNGTWILAGGRYPQDVPLSPIA